jgi:hypothetical protein
MVVVAVVGTEVDSMVCTVVDPVEFKVVTLVEAEVDWAVDVEDPAGIVVDDSSGSSTKLTVVLAEKFAALAVTVTSPGSELDRYATTVPLRADRVVLETILADALLNVKFTLTP